MQSFFKGVTHKHENVIEALLSLVAQWVDQLDDKLLECMYLMFVSALSHYQMNIFWVFFTGNYHCFLTADLQNDYVIDLAVVRSESPFDKPRPLGYCCHTGQFCIQSVEYRDATSSVSVIPKEIVSIL